MADIFDGVSLARKGGSSLDAFAGVSLAEKKQESPASTDSLEEPPAPEAPPVKSLPDMIAEEEARQGISRKPKPKPVVSDATRKPYSDTEESSAAKFTEEQKQAGEDPIFG